MKESFEKTWEFIRNARFLKKCIGRWEEVLEIVLAKIRLEGFVVFSVPPSFVYCVSRHVLCGGMFCVAACLLCVAAFC
ncbi:hypothetical protein HWV54_02895 [Bartonella alsatica]|uniref:Uncharacterized protein n=2 Tax=Bartonella alsatica TaxID=52764 RepID=J0YI76_9HYPH|nr:hypothetical protein [Bartonella alsatica]EJF74193.1 hypothetical protein MEC_01332 [Bartonella alsatica IBS 382]QLC51867.1 hypothetical protein HWV54_02895 [Bartonella alsatica]